MRKMKDSGVEWIGEIPVDWKLSKIGSVYDERNEKVSDKDFAPLSVTKQGIVPQLETAAKTDNGDNRKLIRKDDFVINSRSDRRGSCGISEYEGSCSLINTVLKPQTNMCNRYYGFVFKSDGFADEYYRWGHGIVDDLWSTKWIDMKSIYIPAPDIIEQERLADYLDSKCSKIDEIIEKQQAIIEKLKEYKLSTITEVVTSGLNQKREMKDSHVLSIGRIPTNWDVTKLKYLFGNGDDGLKIGPFGSAIKGKTLESGLYKIYNQAHLINNDFSLNRHYVSEDTFNDLKAYEVKPGDVLFSMMGTIGKCQIMPKGYPKGIMDSHLLKARLNEKVIPEFFIYAYDKDFSNQVIQQLLYTSNGTIMNGLNSTILKNVYIALPPLEEQEEIVEFLNKFTKNIDDRIGVKTKIVEKLQEYKKSLIYEVVTGKKEV